MKFFERVADKTTKKINTLQINIGKQCNLTCIHCHVEADPMRTEIMDAMTFDKCIDACKKFGFDTIDITGGEPTIHPYIENFIVKATQVAKTVIVRTNLVALSHRENLLTTLAQNKVKLVASMNCYTEENVSSMRGKGTFEEIKASIKALNELGYGDKLELDIVYNPLGAFLPGPQESLEADYKRELDAMGGLKFSRLLTITNIPMGRFKTMIEKSGEYEDYMKLLEDNFNPSTLDNIMCRTQVSVGYDGRLYDCDFNQMEELPCNSYKTIDELLSVDTLDREIIFRDYCYGCTAGAGSSCGGALSE